MELVYLWVEQFRNIEKQGFNLNPKYEVQFTSDIETPKLSVEDLGEQNPSLFDGKISNVSVFIGKNGSGKSNLLDLLGHRFSERKGTHLPGDGYFILYHVK